LAVAWSIFCVAGLVFSLRCCALLRRGSPWSLTGWLATAAYFALALVAVVRTSRPLRLTEVAALVLVLLAFVVAGVRDERQAEPYWWPVRVGLTGRERRAARRL
jgi:hypothetical protein